jgi:hypothetical protein
MKNDAMERFRECAEDTQSKIYFDYFDEGVRVLIIRGPASVNCYLGVPMSHPLAGFDYDSLPVECHGGLTFSKEGDDSPYPKGFWWYGYDYGHCDDLSFCDLRYSVDRKNNAHPWTPEEVKKDAWSAIYSFRKLMQLAERIYFKCPVSVKTDEPSRK